MAMPLNDVLRKLEAVEANLEKLDRIWKEIRPLLEGVSSWAVVSGVSDEDRYRDRARVFKHILQQLPSIDGYKPEYILLEPEVILSTRFDLAELGEPTAEWQFQGELVRQGELLDEYRFRLGLKRRLLARQSMPQYIESIDKCLECLKQSAESLDANEPIPAEGWEPLRHAFNAISSLVGSGFGRSKRWYGLARHIHFGLKCDFDDIIRLDWPAVKSKLQELLYAEDDPIPVDVEDVGEMIASHPTGDVVTELKWDKVRPKDFERLLFNLITSTPGYENPTWLTHTNAPDDGRDLSVERVLSDKLAGVNRQRVIIACKHWTSKSVDLSEVALLKDQMKLWEPPRVDCLVVAASGRFTTQAIRWVERHNQSDSALKIEMWPGTHFEWLLAQRPALIAEFGLR